MMGENTGTNLTARYKSLLDCCAARIYHHGLTRVADRIGIATSNLCTSLKGVGGRNFGVDKLEKFYEEFNDLEPLFYQIDRWLKGKEGVSRDEVLNKAASLMTELQSMVKELKE